MPKVLVSDDLSETAVQIFRDRGIEVDYQPQLGRDKDALAAVIDRYDGLAIRSATKVTGKLLDRATNLKVVGRAGIGVDNVDIPAASKKGVIVMNTPFGNSVTTAEHTIAMMFSIARQIPEANASTRAGKWEKSRFMGREVAGKTDNEGDARRATSLLYHVASAVAFAWEGSRIHEMRGDARRLLLSRMVVDHRLLAGDPFRLTESAVQRTITKHLLGDRNVGMAEVGELLTAT